TSCVLLAFAAVGVDPKSASVRRAVEFLRAHQNSDGGWGEDIDTYAHPERAGMGASMPPLTGMVVTALVAVDEAQSPRVELGLASLVGQPRPDGPGSTAEWMPCSLPPQYFYYLPGEPRHYTLEALGCYLAARDAARPAVEAVAPAAASSDGGEPTLPPR